MIASMAYLQHKPAFTLLWKELVAPQTLQDNFKMLCMLFDVFAINQYIIKVYYNKFANESTQNLVH